MRKNHQTARVFESRASRAIRLDYLLFEPTNPATRNDYGWPLLVFFHGSGERGQRVARVAAHGPPRLVKSQPEFPFVVASPQCPAGQLWSVDVLLPFIDVLLVNNPVDPGRVYLTGLSMGGYATWALGMAAPERFAAIAPICGGGIILPLLLADRAKTRELKTLGVWAFHGAKDPVVKLEESERLISAFRRLGNDAKLTVYPEAGHDSWTESYENPALYAWLLKHERPARRA